MKSNLEIVILKCPYANWAEPGVPELFSKTVALKLKGYQNKHFFGVMPIDGTDFVTDHILICRREGSDLTPILGAKSLPEDLCGLFQVEFTCRDFFKKFRNSPQLEALESILENTKTSDRRVSYFSSWTMDPAIRGDKAFVQQLKELFTAAGVGLFQEDGITDLFGIGLPKFKTDRFFFEWGFERAALAGHSIPDFILPNFGGIDAIFMHLKEFSPHAMEMTRKYQDFWQNRTTFGKSVKELIKDGVVELPKKAA